MATNVGFQYGKYEQYKSLEKQTGTLYFTTDYPNLYFHTPDGNTVEVPPKTIVYKDPTTNAAPNELAKFQLFVWQDDEVEPTNPDKAVKCAVSIDGTVVPINYNLDVSEMNLNLANATTALATQGKKDIVTVEVLLKGLKEAIVATGVIEASYNESTSKHTITHKKTAQQVTDPVESAQTPEFGATFQIPKLTIDEYGHTTAIEADTVQLPTPEYPETNITVEDSGSGNVVGSISASGDTITQTKVDAVLTSGAQSVGGVKTFTDLPVASATPTADGQVANKKYVDDQIKANVSTVMHFKGTKESYEELPPVDEAILGDVYFVSDSNKEYVLVNKGGETNEWEELGAPISLDGYMNKLGTSGTGKVLVSSGDPTTIQESDFTIEKSVPSDAKFTDTTYTATDGVKVDTGNVIKHSTSSSTDTSSVTLDWGKGTEVFKATEIDDFGHVISGTKVTLTMPETPQPQWVSF